MYPYLYKAVDNVSIVRGWVFLKHDTAWREAGDEQSLVNLLLVFSYFCIDGTQG